MSTLCKELENLGASKCSFPMKVGRRLVYVPTYGADGVTKNSMSLDPVNTAEYIGTLENWTDRFDEVDPEDRFYTLPVMENVTDERADTEFFEWDSGLKARIRQGARTFVGLIPSEWPSLLGHLQSWAGGSFGVYIIDTAGNIVFNYGVDDTGEARAYPVPVDGNSYDAKLVKPTYTDPGSIMVQFDYIQDVDDKDLYLVDSDPFGFDPRTSDFYALTVLYQSDEAWVVSTSYTVTLKLDYGVPASGFATGVAATPSADWTIALAGVLPAVPFTDGTVIESTPGVYDFASGATDLLDAGTIIYFKKVKYENITSTTAA